MKKILPILLLLFSLPVIAQYEVNGGQGRPLMAKDDPNNRIQVYLLNGLEGAEISYTSTDGIVHYWYQYKERAGDATPVQAIQTGNKSTLTHIESNCGYFVGDPADPKTVYIWIADYREYAPVFNSLRIDDGASDICETLKLLIDVEARPIYYRIYSGVPVELDRFFTLKYNTLIWDEENLSFSDKAEIVNINSKEREWLIDAPLTDTDFTLSGDQFANHFNQGGELKTGTYSAIAVDANVVTQRIPENPEGETELGGSAPIDITFTTYANEPVAAMYIWKLYNENGDTLVRYNGEVFNYIFNQSGTFGVRLEASDQTSTCTNSTNTFNISISNWDIFIPNVFTPAGSPGVNDVFKITYKSIISFKGWIFSQWGNQLYHWTDPDEGWDGKVRGKVVPTGAYYYVIEIEVPDGTNIVKKRYKGAINVIKSNIEYPAEEPVL